MQHGVMVKAKDVSACKLCAWDITKSQTGRKNMNPHKNNVGGPKEAHMGMTDAF